MTALRRAQPLRGAEDRSSDWFFLAMAEWRTGKRDSAGEWYDKAVAWMDEHKPDDAELRRFRAEAAKLLGVPEKDAG